MKEKLIYSLDDIVGYDAEKERIKRIIHDINNFDILKKQGIYLPKGLIISGPPGVGKTLIAKIISDQCKVNFFICDLSYSGKVASQELLDIFRKASKKKPAIIYIDELDKYLPNEKSDRSSVYQKETLSTLLTILDGFSETDGIMFLATTSSKDDLPSEVLRAGRIDEHICLSLPTREERGKIFYFYLKKLSLDCSLVNMDTLLSKTSSFSGADLKSLINKTAAKVQYLNRNSLKDEDFYDSINEIRFQDIKKRKNKGSEKITAYHELGHYVAAKYLLGVSCDISIENYDDDLGATILQDKVKFNEDDEGIDVRKRSSLLKLVTICLSGRAAEEVFIGQPCVGCEADYKQAILMLSNMCEEGMFGDDYVNLDFLDSNYESSNDTRDFILKMLKAQHVLATKIIDENKKFIKAALPKLMDKGFLSGEEMDKINYYHPITHEVQPILHVLNEEQEDPRTFSGKLKQAILDTVLGVNQSFGATMVIGILKGSKNSRIYQNGFDSLSTYGMYYKKDGNKVIEKMIKEMIEEDILYVTGGLYSVLKITKNFMTKAKERKEEAQKQLEGDSKILGEENDDE